ncbi:MAG: BMP family ABC transporter substrate-binding protein [Lachnospiraceae bacterium]|jgi:basic membrane protein A|nr:BMP family ABC transporter substrate-binding protein [Lachnospiraceae bacterium]MCH4028043.1 BMP family ABC transporter substrate-binding protein [Lachnospiraceae bacterium]MCH4065887.1 BMP family ABC transporter substrate-binding protein [Lachnospiraceae bacterium]MCH4111923.1 BMP family ABC transporter substrate-binding protein [Lachnospiraceae bacterium]MCI1352278.1 BMP family ABC transporter substrate-binding protein [Lachnospiraceae bacterium]
MKKKVLCTVLSAAMILALAGCGSTDTASTASTAAAEASTEASAAATTGAAQEQTTEASEAASSEAAATGDASDMKIAMITDYGDITDESFNQITYETSKAWAEENGCDFTYYKPEGDSTADRVAMIDKAVADGYNVLVMPGYAFAGAIVETADMYPDVKYVAIDVSQFDFDSESGEDGWTRDNVFSAIYQEELPGYMAGYAAVKLGYKKLGFLGGMAVPAVIRYGYGYVQGADEAAGELGLTDVEVKYAYANQFYGDSDITAAMDTWYQNGTEVVFACGGGVYTSAGEAAQKVDGKVIGVDVDQKATIDGLYGDGMTVTSAMKGLGATVNTLLAAIRDGQWDQYKGKIDNLGLVSGDDMSLNYVGLPEESTQWSDSFTDDDYKALVAKMYSGEITVDNDTTKEQPTATNITVDFQGNIK